jgi:hypothetical protein
LNHQLREEKQAQTATFNQSTLKTQRPTKSKSDKYSLSEIAKNRNQKSNKLLADFSWEEYMDEIEDLAELLQCMNDSKEVVQSVL